MLQHDAVRDEVPQRRAREDVGREVRLLCDARESYQTGESVGDPGYPAPARAAHLVALRTVALGKDGGEREGGNRMAGGKCGILSVEQGAVRLEPGVREVAGGKNLARAEPPVDVLHDQREQFRIGDRFTAEQRR